jgi:c-di-AMP phosphodiesterase-like protein
MKNFITLCLFAFILTSCTNFVSSRDTFTLTTSDGKKEITNYVKTPSPTKTETFSLQYTEESDCFRWDFLVFVDNNNTANLDVFLPSKPQIGVIYSSDNYDIVFKSRQNRKDLNIASSVVTFLKSKHPNHISGIAKGYDSKGALVLTGNFDLKTL